MPPRPEPLGIARAPQDSLRGGDAFENAGLVRAVLLGEGGPRRDAVVMNAGFALWIAGLAESPREGIAAAEQAIDRGGAEATLRAVRDTLEASSNKAADDSSEGGSP